jgi:AcrR family transcriptional regulator
MAATRNPDRTRQTLLQAAFEEIYEHGFQAASLDNILAKTGVTKGALYHHFKNKKELGYSVIEEIIRPMTRETWVKPLEEADDPIEGFKRIFDDAHTEHGAEAVQYGCPLNNLAQEMSPLDEGFRQRIQATLEIWRGGIAEALARGQIKGSVRSDVDVEKTATFILASLEGTVGLAKNAQDPAVFEASRYSLETFLDSLRPAEVAVG